MIDFLLAIFATIVPYKSSPVYFFSKKHRDAIQKEWRDEKIPLWKQRYTIACSFLILLLIAGFISGVIALIIMIANR